MESAIWGLVGTIVGALASIGTSWISNRTASSLQAAKVHHERLEVASAFQRQTLLDVQEAIHDALRLVHHVYFEDLKAYRTTQRWGSSLLPVVLDEELRLAMRKVSILVERVADDPLRSQIKTLMCSTAQIQLAPSEADALLRLEKTGADARQTLEQIGTVLRSHYQPTTVR